MGEGVKQPLKAHENWFLLPTYMHAGASSTPQYAYSPVGLFPCPVGPSTRFSIVEEVCSKFRFLGKFMAKAIMDSRMVSVSECVCASLQLGPGRLCQNFKYNRLFYFGENYAGIIGTFSHLNGNNRLDCR